MARRYRLADWTDEAGPEADWLTPLDRRRLDPEHPNGGSWCIVNSRRIKRWSLNP